MVHVYQLSCKIIIYVSLVVYSYRNIVANQSKTIIEIWRTPQHKIYSKPTIKVNKQNSPSTTLPSHSFTGQEPVSYKHMDKTQDYFKFSRSL